MPADAGGQTVQPAPLHAPRRDDVIAHQAVVIEAEADLDGGILDRHVGPAGAYPEQGEHRVPPGIDADREAHGTLLFLSSSLSPSAIGPHARPPVAHLPV